MEQAENKTRLQKKTKKKAQEIIKTKQKIK